MKWLKFENDAQLMTFEQALETLFAPFLEQTNAIAQQQITALEEAFVARAEEERELLRQEFEGAATNIQSAVQTGIENSGFAPAGQLMAQAGRAMLQAAQTPVQVAFVPQAASEIGG